MLNYITLHVVLRNISSRFYSNSEVNTPELFEIVKKCFLATDSRELISNKSLYKIYHKISRINRKTNTD